MMRPSLVNLPLNGILYPPTNLQQLSTNFQCRRRKQQPSSSWSCCGGPGSGGNCCGGADSDQHFGGIATSAEMAKERKSFYTTSSSASSSRQSQLKKGFGTPDTPTGRPLLINTAPRVSQITVQ